MSEPISAPKGTYDILPADQPVRRWVIARAEEVFHRYGYQRIDTPTFEETRLFTRGVGESTDIVRKEMYTFEDLGGRSMTLAPRGHRPRRPCLRRARHAYAPSAGEALLPQPHVPLREPAVGPVSAALPTGGRGLRLASRRGSTRRSSECWRRCIGSSVWTGSNCGSTRWAARPAGRGYSARCGSSWTPTPSNSAVSAGNAHGSTPSARSIARCRNAGVCSTRPRDSPTISARLRGASRPSASTFSRYRVSISCRGPPARSGDGLLHSHHLRVPEFAARRPVRSRRWRPLRRSCGIHRRAAYLRAWASAPASSASFWLLSRSGGGAAGRQACRPRTWWRWTAPLEKPAFRWPTRLEVGVWPSSSTTWSEAPRVR